MTRPSGLTVGSFRRSLDLRTEPKRVCTNNRPPCRSISASLWAASSTRVPSVKASVRELSGGQRQGVAIARATHWATKLVLMDEPTAALGVAETAKVEQIIRGLRARNLAILMISHNLDQVFRIADRVCVLRRGAQVGWRKVAETTGDEIVAMITGLAKG